MPTLPRRSQAKKQVIFNPFLYIFSDTICSDMKNATGFTCGVLLAKILSDVMSDVLLVVTNCGIIYKNSRSCEVFYEEQATSFSNHEYDH